ncbi:MAG: hypothetical protein ABSE73_14495 [Planctomycetota bacterium]
MLNIRHRGFDDEFFLERNGRRGNLGTRERTSHDKSGLFVSRFIGIGLLICCLAVGLGLCYKEQSFKKANGARRLEK